MQLDSFNKANTQGSRRLSKLFSRGILLISGLKLGHATAAWGIGSACSPQQLARVNGVPLSFANVQLDSFNKANTRGSRRLSKLFSGRKSPKTPSPGGGSTPGGPGAPALTLEEMLLYQTVDPLWSC